MHHTDRSQQNPTDHSADTDLHRMIAEAAYFLAEQRGFQGGYTMDDWLAAERQVKHLVGTDHESAKIAKFAATQAAADGIEGDARKPDKTVDEKIAANMADRK